MANLKELRTRIASVKSTQKITKAMKAIAAAKFKLAQINLENFKQYAKKISNITSIIANQLDEHPLIISNSSSKKDEIKHDNNHLILIISSDKGLCGSFNVNINRFLEEKLAKVNLLVVAVEVEVRIDVIQKRPK